MRTTTFILFLVLLLLTAGCERRLTYTRLDLLSLPLPIVKPDQKARTQLEADLNTALTKFLKICDQEAEEAAPSHPLPVKHLYVYDATENVGGMWGFRIFDEYKQWIEIYKTQKDVSIVANLTDVVSSPGSYLLKRAVLEQTTVGQFTFRGGRQEFIDTVTGEVKSSRTNYYLGSDFARGISCLDSNWSEGFRSFVNRSVGFSPGLPRSDAWVQEVSRRFVRAELETRRSTDAADFAAPIRPEASVYDYNNRQIVIDGVAHYLRQTFNNEPLRMVGVQTLPNRTLISYETNSRAPSVLFQIRNRTTGQLLQEIFVKIPLSLHLRNDKSVNLHPWRLAREGVTLKNGKVSFDIVQRETETDAKTHQHFRYSLIAPWSGENIERTDLPSHLDDGYYGKFSLPKSGVGRLLSDKNVIGRWVSDPAGALWEFKNDNTIVLNGSKWMWRIADGSLSAEHDHSNKERATFRTSKDGKVLEVTLSNRARTYEPFVIRRVQTSN